MAAPYLPMPALSILKMVFLSEENCVKEPGEVPVIFKYQAVPEIVKEIFALMAENDRIIEDNINININ